MIDLLRNVSIFETASEDLLREVAGALETVFVNRGQTVCRQGEPGRKLYLIRCGQVRISVRSSEGEEETLGYLGPGDCFGEMSLVTGEPVSADVAATVPTELAALDGVRFTQLCDLHPILYRGISKTLSRRLSDTNRRRFVTRLGQVTRFTADQESCNSVLLCQQIKELAKTLAEASQRPVLVLAPHSHHPEAPDLPDAGGSDESLDLSATLKEIQAKYPSMSFQCFSHSNRFDLVLWSSADGEPLWDCEKSIQEIISRFKHHYPQILVSQFGWPLEVFLKQLAPDDQVSFMLDCTPPQAQVPASREDYNLYVPEGHRYPPRVGEKQWVLSASSLQALRRIRELIQLSFADRRRVHVLLVHSGERAVLDYSRVRQIFTGFMVDSLPTNEAADATEPTVSTALLLGRNPRLARSRIVRGLAGMRVGLALGGGGARGLAHVGVIRVLEEEGIPIDMLAGSSFGSVVAAGYAEGRSAKRLEADMRYHWSKLGNFLLDIRDYNIPHTALLRGRKIRRMIDIAMAGAKIEECQTPVYVVCTDLVTGKEVVLDRGEMGLAVWASGSLPGIFKPVRWGEYLLVDGAVLNKVPAKVLQQKGAHVVLVVNVTPEHDREIEVKDASMLPLRSRIARYVPVLRNWVQEPNILKIISRSMTVSGIHYSRIDSDAIDVEIKPRIEHFDFLRFDQFDDIVEAGAEAARKAMPEIREVLARKH